MNAAHNCPDSTMTPPSGWLTVSGNTAPIPDADRPRRPTVRIAVPREIKKHEYRVALTPAGVHELVSRGHDVFIERGAGAGSSISDEEYVDAGANTLATANDTGAECKLALKVKEPIAEESPRL